MEHRLVLDTVNEVSRALLELVPWRAREGLDKLVSDANEQYKLVSDTVGQRVDEIDAAIQRSQQVMYKHLCINLFGNGDVCVREKTMTHINNRLRNRKNKIKVNPAQQIFSVMRSDWVKVREYGFGLTQNT